MNKPTNFDSETFRGPPAVVRNLAAAEMFMCIAKGDKEGIGKLIEIGKENADVMKGCTEALRESHRILAKK